jgi:cytochrome d ubiquinol oxidase subunit I
MRVPEAVTGAKGIPIGYGTLIVVYSWLAAAVWWMLHRFSRVPLDPEYAETVATVSQGGSSAG